MTSPTTRFFPSAYALLLSSLSLSAVLAAGCGSPLVGLECRDGFERCGTVCYDFTSDPSHCGGCNNACGEGEQCIESMCRLDDYLPDGGRRDGGADGGDGGQNRDGGDGGDDMDASRDGGFDMDAGDGGGGDASGSDARVGDGSTSDGRVGDGSFTIPDGSMILPDGAVILPDGAVFDPGGDDGDAGGNPDGSTVVVPPALCTGAGSPLDCVCDLGQTRCDPQLICVNTKTDPANCGGCGIACNNDEYCNDGACSLVCTPPLFLCGGLCVDRASDDANCGSCGNACGSAAACIPTGLVSPAITGECVGEAVGHIVVVGHDMSGTLTRPIRQIVGNTVFLAPRNPVRILAYDAETSVASRVGVSAAIVQSSAAIGRAYTLTTADPMNVTQQLGSADVFVIETQQNASNFELSTLGATWSAALHSFLFRGGVILLFDGSGNNDGTYQILKAATEPDATDPINNPPVPLFNALSRTALSQRIIGLVTPSDAVAAGVPTEYQSQGQTVGFTLDSPSSAVVVIADRVPTTPMASTLPVVTHETTR